MSAEVDGVLLGGDEAVGFALPTQLLQITDVLCGVGVVVTKESLRRWFDRCGSQLQQKILWARNTTKYNGPAGNIFRRNATASPPNQLSIQRKRVRRRAAGEHNGIGTTQRTQRFSQATGGQEAIARVFRSDKDDIEVAGQSAMLEAIVQEVKLRAEFCFRK